MAGPISKLQLINASIDADDLAIILNAPASYQSQDSTLPPGYMRTRLGLVVRVLAKALQDIVMSGDVDDAAVKALADFTAQNIQMINSRLAEIGVSPNELIVDQVTGEKFTFAIADEMGDAPFLIDLFGGALFAKSRIRALGNNNGNFAFAIADKKNEVALGILNDGTTQMGSNIIGNNTATNFSFAIADPKGNVAFGIYDDGGVYFGPQSERDPLYPMKHNANQQTGYMHIFQYGQSLSRGSTGIPLRSVTQPYSNVTFNSGVLIRPLDNNSDIGATGVPYDGTAFKPLIEERPGTHPSGETPASSTVNKLCDYIAADNAGFIGDNIFVSSCPGIGGASIAPLSKGSSSGG